MDLTTVIEACHKLKVEGKVPSVALVKSKMSQKKPLPVIIAGIKHFNANPNDSVLVDKALKADIAEKEPLEARVRALEEMVELQAAEIAELKSRLK